MSESSQSFRLSTYRPLSVAVAASFLQHHQRVVMDTTHTNHFFVTAIGGSIMDFGDVVCVVAVLLKKKKKRKMLRKILSVFHDQPSTS